MKTDNRSRLGNNGRSANGFLLIIRSALLAFGDASHCLKAFGTAGFSASIIHPIDTKDFFSLLLFSLLKLSVTLQLYYYYPPRFVYGSGASSHSMGGSPVCGFRHHGSIFGSRKQIVILKEQISMNKNGQSIQSGGIK